MKRIMGKATAMVLSMSMTISLMATSADVDAAKKIKLSKKSVTLAIGKSSTITIQNVKAEKVKKLTVKSTKKKIVTVKKTDNKKTAFKVTGKAKGSAKIQVKLHLKGQKKTKKLILKVKVTRKQTTPKVQPTASMIPSMAPSAVPSIVPGVEATPSTQPSITPGVGVNPTVEPVVEPTLTPVVSPLPTATLTVSVAPTGKPTITPTAEPTVEPMVTPKVTPEATAPTSEPMPTVVPTVEPTVEPTATPVASETDTLQIESVVVTENRKLIIIFNEPSTITTDNLVIKTKNTEQDNYGEALAIESIEKIDPLQYEVVLDTTSGNYITNNGFVQVSVAKLSGTPLVAEDQFECKYETTTRQWIVRLTHGTDVHNTFINLYNEDFVGELQYEVIGDMPDGLSYWLSGRNLYVSGTPEKVGAFKSVVDITDEAGNNLIYNCTYLVGDAENLYASAAEEYILVGKKEEANIKATGGSGTYTYTKVEGEYEFAVDSNGKVTAEFAEAGTYKLYVDVADAENANLTTRVEVVYYVEGICTISGVVRDLGGSNLYFRGGGLDIYVIPQDREIQQKYSLYKPTAALQQTNSIFSIDVPAGIYDIQFESDYGSVYKVIKDVEVKDSFMSLGVVELPVCQVNLEAPNEDNLYEIYWRDDEGVLIGRNETFLVRPGTYTLHSDPDISPVMASLYDFTVTFTATNDSVYKVVTATPTGDNITEVTLGSDVDVSLDSTLRKWYKFTPNETGMYRFFSTGLEEDMFLNIYSDTQYDNSDYHYLTFTYTFQTCRNGKQVNRTNTLVAGTTYYIELDLIWNNKQDDFVFGVEKAE